MTIAKRVNDFISEKRPNAVCDDCLAESLGLSRRQQAQRVTSALGTTAEFQRSEGICAQCGGNKLVIRHA